MSVRDRTTVAVGRVEDVPLNEGKTVTVAGRPIALFHTEAGFRAIAATCPHRGGPLADGLVGGGTVICPLHGWLIDLTRGIVVAGGEGTVPVYPVIQRDGWIYIEFAT